MNCERNICYQQEYNGGCDTCPCNRTAEESSEVETTTQEAMETLKFLLSIERHHKEPLRMAIEALEKQEPKPIYELKETRLSLNVRYDKFRCSVCGFMKGFTNGHVAQYKYCPQCGQRIDWRMKND